MNSNHLFYLISIDSFFNGLLFILIYNIKLSKKDKIEYYGSFILSVKVRYLYYGILWLLSILLKILLFRDIDISLFANPLFVYLFYQKLYFHRIVSWINHKTYRQIQNWISICIYHIIQFLCKTVLSEESNIRVVEIKAFYEKVGYGRLIQFLQSFGMACVYEYVSTNYSYLGYVLSYHQFRDNYDKKQHILGILNSKDWDKLFHSSTIGLFFDIYRNSNNKQIAKYIQYQLTRFQYKLLILFSVWSIIGMFEREILIPILFYFIYIDEWLTYRYVYYTLSIFSCINPIHCLSIILFLIHGNYYIRVYRKILSIKVSIKEICSISAIFLLFLSPNYFFYIFLLISLAISPFQLWLGINYIIILSLGLLSDFNYFHGLSLIILSILFRVLYKNI